MLIEGIVTKQLLTAVLMMQFALPLPDIHIYDSSEGYPEPFAGKDNPAFYYHNSGPRGGAYGTEKTTAFQWIDEICEHSFGFDASFPSCEAPVSDYCSDNPEECPSEWCQKYITDGYHFLEQAQSNECVAEKYKYLKDKIGKEYRTYSEYDYAVSHNKLYLQF